LFTHTSWHLATPTFVTASQTTVSTNDQTTNAPPY
jgi:hypothetical protein